MRASSSFRRAGREVVGSGLGSGSNRGVNVLYHDHAGESINGKLRDCQSERGTRSFETDGFGAWSERTAVLGRLSDRPSLVKAVLVSPSLIPLNSSSTAGGEGRTEAMKHDQEVYVLPICRGEVIELPGLQDRGNGIRLGCLSGR